MTRLRITTAVLAAALLTTTGLALASSQFKQTANVTLTATKPNASSGIKARIFSSDPGAPLEKPLALKLLTLTFPTNTKFNFKSGALRQCNASEAEIKATKGSACPAKSRIGTGSAAINGVPAFSSAAEAVTAFAGKNEVILLLLPTGPAGSTLVLHGKVTGNRLTAAVPLLAVGPVTFVLTELKLTVNPIGKGSSTFIRAGKCTKRKFVVRSSFVYYTGEKLTLTSSSRCR